MVRDYTDALWRLLPPNATALENDLLTIVPFDNVLDPVLPNILTSKIRSIPDNVLPWLIVEYDLGGFSQYQPNERTLVSQGMAINRLKGTVGAIKMVMPWLGYPDVYVFQEPLPTIHFAEFQYDLGKVPTDLSDVCAIKTLTDLVKPVRGRLRRLYHGWNEQPVYLDSTDLDCGLLDNYSGVWSGDFNLCGIDPQLWLSFGTDHGGSIAGPLVPIGGHIVLADHITDYLWDAWVCPQPWPVLDDDYPNSFDWPFGIAFDEYEGEGSVITFGLTGEWGSMGWDNNTWGTEGCVLSDHSTETNPPPDNAIVTETGADLVTQSGNYIVYL